MIRLFRVFVPVGTLALLISEILLIIGAFVLSSFLLMPNDPTDYILYEGGMWSILLVAISILLGLYFHDLYSEVYITSHIVLLQQLCMVIGIAFLMQGVVSYVDQDLRIPLRVMGLSGLLIMVTIFVWRILFTTFVLQVVGRDRLLLVGDSQVLAEIARHASEYPEKGLVVTGYISDGPGAETRLPGKVLGPMSSLLEVVKATQPSHIVVGMQERRNNIPVNELLDLRFAGHIIEEAAAAYERVCGRVCVKELRPSQLIYSGELGPRKHTLLYQSLSNLFLACIGIIVTLPLMLIVALAVRLSSAGPIFYRQVRVGLNGVNFTLYKFRSMKVDAEAQSGAVWATKNDPRVTPVGRIIRKTRLDELPQLLNVLKGEMSIVGPRPERPEFVEALTREIPYYRQRHCVRPGITGWAQINYKYGDTAEDTIEKLEYDLFYIKNLSMSLDNYIIFHTLKTMLLSRGAQ
jgi:sugar transferase (PEP-CTERM system associated)